MRWLYSWCCHIQENQHPELILRHHKQTLPPCADSLTLRPRIPIWDLSNSHEILMLGQPLTFMWHRTPQPFYQLCYGHSMTKDCAHCSCGAQPSLGQPQKSWGSFFAHGCGELLVLCKIVTGLFYLSFRALSSITMNFVVGRRQEDTLSWSCPVQASGCNTQNKEEKRSSLNTGHFSLPFFHIHTDLSALAGAALFILNLGYLSHQLLCDMATINTLPFMVCSQHHQG